MSDSVCVCVSRSVCTCLTVHSCVCVSRSVCTCLTVHSCVCVSRSVCTCLTVQCVCAGTPRNINFEEVRATMLAIEGVRDLHDLRVWSLTMDKTALAVHLAVGTSLSHSLGGRVEGRGGGSARKSCVCKDVHASLSVCRHCESERENLCVCVKTVQTAIRAYTITCLCAYVYVCAYVYLYIYLSICG